MYKKVMADMEKTTLLRMRDEEGMSMQEIATSIGCSKATVYRIIGPMTPEERARRKSEAGRRGAASKWSKTSEGGYTVERKMHSYMQREEPQADAEPAAVLAVKRAPIMLSGAFMHYVVSADGKTIDVETEEGRALMQIPAEKLETFIAELTAIHKNIGVQKPMQFWG